MFILERTQVRLLILEATSSLKSLKSPRNSAKSSSVTSMRPSACLFFLESKLLKRMLFRESGLTVGFLLNELPLNGFLAWVLAGRVWKGFLGLFS
jgi:hypothetical protein